jgi:hypothetical protein
MYVLLAIIMFLLSACSLGPPQESRLSYAQRVCAASATDPTVREEFMRQCIAMEMNRGSAPMGYYAPSSSIRTGNSMYNNPDAFGPMGVWGPTWQEFNGAYQQNSRPQMQPMPPMPPMQNRARDYMR